MPEPEGLPVVIHIDAATSDRLEAHAYSNLHAEVGGMLVGHVRDGVTNVIGAVPALNAATEQVSLTFTHEVWNDILRDVDAQFPGSSIVGWYHTHPSFGLFLSQYDEFIQRNFFSAPGQLALVIDPIAGRQAWFTLRGEELIKFGETDTRRGARGRSSLSEDSGARPQLGLAKTIAVAVIAAVLTGAVVWAVGLSTRPPDATAALQQRNAEFDALAAEYAVLQGLLGETLANPVVLYTVREGDTIEDLALSVYGHLDAADFIRSLNGLLADEELVAGDVLRLADLPGVQIDSVLRADVPVPAWVPPPPDRDDNGTGVEEGGGTEPGETPSPSPTPSRSDAGDR